jgi:hypothetical protein
MSAVIVLSSLLRSPSFNRLLLTHRLLVRATLHHAWPHPALHALCGRRINRGGGDPDGHSYRQKNSSSPHVLLPPDWSARNLSVSLPLLRLSIQQTEGIASLSTSNVTACLSESGGQAALRISAVQPPSSCRRCRWLRIGGQLARLMPPFLFRGLAQREHAPYCPTRSMSRRSSSRRDIPIGTSARTTCGWSVPRCGNRLSLACPQ